MKKKTKIIIIIIALVLILALIGILVVKKLNVKIPEPPKQIEVIDNVTNYEYALEDRDYDIYKENFTKLKDILNEEEIDYQSYSEYIAKLFLIDLYTIENKISKYDVGGVDFIYPDDQEKFKNKVIDTLYKLVMDNSTSTRKQELPKVSNVIIENTKETTYELAGKNVASFEITASIEYEKDLGYDKNVKLVTAILDKHAYVVNLSPIKK